MRHRIATIVFACALGACAGPPPNHMATFHEYVDAVNSKAIDDALALHTDDAEFILPGQKPIRGLDEMRSLLEWDAAMNARIRFRGIEERGDTLVIASGSERNAWFQGVGLDSIEYGPGLRVVFEGALIRGVYPSALTPESAAAFQTRVGEFFGWAAVEAPEDLRKVMPEGVFRYDAPSARAWIALLDRYQKKPGGL